MDDLEQRDIGARARPISRVGFGLLRVRDSSRCGHHVDASLRANVAGVRSDRKLSGT
jgi:hypothetical protein